VEFHPGHGAHVGFCAHRRKIQPISAHYKQPFYFGFIASLAFIRSFIGLKINVQRFFSAHISAFKAHCTCKTLSGRVVLLALFTFGKSETKQD
jgi:hypothetical protein